MKYRAGQEFKKGQNAGESQTVVSELGLTDAYKQTCS